MSQNSKQPTVEDFVDWLEGKKAEEGIGPNPCSYFSCGGCALGQYAKERLGVTSLDQFMDVFPSFIRYEGWGGAINQAHSSGEARTRETLLNVAAHFLPKDKLPKLNTAPATEVKEVSHELTV